MADKPNSSSLIREAIDAGVTSPKAIAEWVKEKHDVEVKPSLVNNVKFHYMKKPSPAKRGRPKGSTKTPAASPAVATSSGSKGGSLAIEDILAVKELVDRFGKEGLTKLVDVL
jgi:hypothetical protein